MLEQIKKARKFLDAEKPAAALKILAGLKKNETCAEALFLRGEAWRQAGEFNNALACYDRGLKLKSCGRELRLEILIKKAAASRALGLTSAALKAAGSALILARSSGFFIPEAELELALAHRLAGNFSRAEPALKRLHVLYRRRGDWEAVSFVLWSLGGLWRLQGRYKLSIKAFEGSAAFAAKAGDKAARGYALFGLGGVKRVAGHIESALKPYREARAMFSGSSDIFARAYAECGMSNVLRQLGRLDEALKGYKRAHKLYSAIKDGPDLGFVEWGIGEVYKKRGELAKAEGAFKRAEKLFSSGFGRSVGQRPLGRHPRWIEPRGIILTKLSMAQVNYLLGNTAKAEKLHFTALKEARRHGLYTYLEVFT
ncbi:MAG: hypothetical protein A2X34_05240 [Elusimicrobia bacterium GWC2_51_8]|nr:MAG: hypothetical protein A2X33_05960 [Elusimicrobia bacterium GWA2_51_34]OGR58007.1 MAG: hypothetical protein A2X34_05240 [Elusimicrobia bacterium GWC2_51_8]OGR88190.1 MAG: hypothetical protein A2021_01100 [Elusimicrobia bacterium GWF2_52_66]HAF95394.1 hypothetical protein [Elusimicrobiota bacterium]HCD38045.1 hypothetical protein [Candidatus Omnitrophota bacterium]